MNVLLIYPPVDTKLAPGSFPLGLGYIASVLREDGHEIKVLDLRAYAYPQSYVKNLLSQLLPKYDIIGMGGMVTVYAYIKWLCNIIKNLDADKKIIVGGSVVTAMPELFLRKTKADIGCLGEAELTIRELLCVLKKGHSLKNVKGICYRQNNKVYVNTARGHIKNLDCIPFPAWDLFPIGYYINKPIIVDSKERSMNIIASRGCSYGCKFCYRNFGQNVRLRSVNNVIKEIKKLKDDYDVTHFEFQDELFMFKKLWIKNFCERLIEENINITWRCLGRVNLVNLNMLKMMKKAGCNWIGYGVESGSQKMLNLMGKDIKVKQIEKAIRLSRKGGIETTGTFMIGFPGETKWTIKETVKFCKRMKIFNEFFFAVPYPGTILYEQVKGRKEMKDEENFILRISGDMNRLFVNMTQFSDKQLLKLKQVAENKIKKDLLKNKRKNANEITTYRSFTLYADAEIDKKICSDLSFLKGRIIKEIPGIVNLILVGGFGRGEGSVIIQDKEVTLMNDYDIVVVLQKDMPLRKIKTLGKLLANEIKIRSVDLITFKYKDLFTLQTTMFNYDLKYGGYVFYGKQNILSCIPDYNADNISPIEGKILLFNRVICLLESFSTKFLYQGLDKNEKLFLIYQCSKAILSCCDALLLLRGKYHLSYLERCKRFYANSISEFDEEGLVQIATDFKLKPSRNFVCKPIEYWYQACNFFMKVLLYYLNNLYAYGKKFNNYEDFAGFYVGLENNKVAANLELAQIFLLASVKKSDIFDMQRLSIAKYYLQKYMNKDALNLDWENLRKISVGLWWELHNK